LELELVRSPVEPVQGAHRERTRSDRYEPAGKQQERGLEAD